MQRNLEMQEEQMKVYIKIEEGEQLFATVVVVTRFTLYIYAYNHSFDLKHSIVIC